MSTPSTETHLFVRICKIKQALIHSAVNTLLLGKVLNYFGSMSHAWTLRNARLLLNNIISVPWKRNIWMLSVLHVQLYSNSHHILVEIQNETTTPMLSFYDFFSFPMSKVLLTNNSLIIPLTIYIAREDF